MTNETPNTTKKAPAKAPAKAPNKANTAPKRYEDAEWKTKAEKASLEALLKERTHLEGIKANTKVNSPTNAQSAARLNTVHRLISNKIILTSLL